MMHGTAIWKPGGLEPSTAAQPQAYNHKTQSFMKIGGQQKCLVKALIV